MMTGDRAVRDAEGWFSFRGRADDLINVAGFRVGPGEIEACLMGHPAVAMAAAVAMPDPLRGEVVRAHVVLKEGQRAGAEALRAFVRARLAPHMTPAEVVFEPSLPLTETGKVRRAALRAQRSGGRPRS
jgi:acetyl-CoA synthetase